MMVLEYRMLLRGAVTSALLVLLAWSGVARADKPEPLSAQTLKAPSGPASLTGLGESFSANAATGTGSYSVPVALPPGFLVPQVALKYTGGTGRSEVGVGFRLPVLQIYRLTDKGVPEFDENDRFGVGGPDYNEELVLADPVRRVYRLKNEGAFTLFQRDASTDSWTLLHPTGERSVLGATAQSRSAANGKTTRWFVESVSDQFGHQLTYRYATDKGKVYWQGVDYQLEAVAEYRNRVDFAYETRPDPIIDYRYGELEETDRRLKTITVTQGSRLLRRYTLAYADASLWSLLAGVRMEGEDGAPMPALSFEYLQPSSRRGRLVKMEGQRTVTGLDTGRMTFEDVTGDGLPDLVSGDAASYSYSENIDGVRFSSNPVSLGLAGSPDRALDAPGVVLADANGDGFRDVWYPTGDGRFRYFPGGRIDRGRFLGFGAAQIINGNGVLADLTRPEARLTDLNGDGRIDLLYQRAGLSDVWVENQASGGLAQRTMPSLPSGVVLSSGNVELSDFNGDGILDLVQRELGGGKRHFSVWYGFGSGRYASSAQVWEVPSAASKELFLADVNRDGQADLVRVSGSWVVYYLNDGRGRFSTENGSFSGMPEASRTKKVLLADMNGNGNPDIVWLTVDGDIKYLELMGEPNVGLLSRIDNGMGLVTDISYRSSIEYSIEAKLSGAPWRTPMPTAVSVIAELATRDSLEKVGAQGWEQRVSYTYWDGYFDTKEREFRGFARAAKTEWGDELQESRVSELRMHVGRNLDTGADEESLKGKVWLTVEKTENGQVLSSSEALWEQRWLCQEELGAGAAIVLPSCVGIADKPSRKDDLVGIAEQKGALSGAWERQSAPRYTAKKSVFGPWGKPTRVDDFGEVSFPAGRQLGQAWSFAEMNTAVGEDEVVNESDYANSIEVAAKKWLIALPIEQRLKTVAGAIVARSQVFYDGPALVGLALGVLDRGLATRHTQWLAEESRWVSTARVAYNADGLPVQNVDSTGTTTNLAYDTAARVFPVEERLQLEDGLSATFVGAYDRGYGTLTSLVDPNGKTLRLSYDKLGRLTKVVDHLGTDQEPLTTYAYEFGTPDQPISKTTVRQLVERGKGVYRTSFLYSDGMGRSRLAKTQVEDGYIGSGWQTFSPTGAQQGAWAPFRSTIADFEPAPLGTSFTTTQSDALGRPIREYLPSTPEQGPSFRLHQYLPFETRDYDERDSTEATLAYPNVTRVDGLGRVRQVEKTNVAGGQLTKLLWTMKYDTAGRLTSLKDPRAFERSYAYDSLGRLRTLNDPNMGQLQYSYDDVGRPIRQVDALGHEVVSEYGSSGRISRQKILRKDANGTLQPDAEHVFHYDVPKAGGPLASATNLIGKLSWVDYPLGSEHLSYDERGQVTEQVSVLWDGVSPFSNQTRTTHRVRSTFNAAGEETRRELPGDVLIARSYDARGLIKQLSVGAPEDTRNVIESVAYDVRSRATRVDYGNGTRACHQYNARDQLTGTLLAKTTSTSCSPQDFESAELGAFHAAYSWGYDGQLSTVTDRSAIVAGVGRRNASYTYDRLNQLATATTTVGSWEYGYDTIQNLTRTRKQVGSAQPVEQTFSYGESAGPNALTRVGTTQLAYDAVGQLKRYNGYDLKYDPLGQLVQASKSGGKTLQYFYDSRGARRLLVVTLSGGQKQVYRYPTAGYEERLGDGVWRVGGAGQDVELRRALGLRVDATLLDELTAYVNAPAGKPKPVPQEWLDLDGDGDGFDAGDLAVAQQAFWNGLPAGTPRMEWRFVAKDRLGSGVAVADRVGDTVSSRDYEPYGSTSRRTGVQPAQGFTGAEVEPDDDLGLIRMGARYYAPALGRWISPDHHIGESPQRMMEMLLESNLYSYARGNPVSFVDPSGGQSQDDPATYSGPGSIDHGSGMGMLITQRGGQVQSVGSIPEGGGGRGTFVEPRGLERTAALSSPKAGGVPAWLRAAKAKWEAEDRANAQRGVYTELPGWDDLQMGLDILSMAMDATGVGAAASWIPDMLNASISLARGDMTGAQLAVTAAIPIIGVAANLALVARAARRAAALPRLEISASKYPHLAENISHAQQAGHPRVLTHGGDVRANRAAALGDVPNIRGLSRDEYPFASSIEGGAGAWVGHIPAAQQNAQGGLISNFLRSNGIQPGMQYEVIVVP